MGKEKERGAASSQGARGLLKFKWKRRGVFRLLLDHRSSSLLPLLTPAPAPVAAADRLQILKWSFSSRISSLKIWTVSKHINQLLALILIRVKQKGKKKKKKKKKKRNKRLCHPLLLLLEASASLQILVQIRTRKLHIKHNSKSNQLHL